MEDEEDLKMNMRGAGTYIVSAHADRSYIAYAHRSQIDTLLSQQNIEPLGLGDWSYNDAIKVVHRKVKKDFYEASPINNGSFCHLLFCRRHSYYL